MAHKIERAVLAQRIRELDGLTNDERSALLELLNTKKFGLVWENKPEDVEERLREQLPVLTEVKHRAIINGSEHPNHIIIEGDNLEALTALSYTHEGKIDVIYIDPPYNTGNKDFAYNDNYVDAEDGYRHSKWLSFMSKRLKIAKRLLSDKGVIFVSIDDNEQANLKLLCDEVFGNKNFIANLIWKSKSGGANDSKYFAVDHEYIVVYAKQSENLLLNLDAEAEVTTSYNLRDENGEYSLDRLDKQSLGYIESLDFPIIGPDGTIYIVHHKNPLQKVARWRWSQATVKERYNELVFKNGCVYTKNYKKEGTIARSLLIDDRFGRTRTGKTDLSAIFGKEVFTNPKPYKLVRYIEMIASNKNSIILDFFAGSGTTLHATMQLNDDDKGHRQCILVTNNENNICEEVTYERNKRVINGYTTSKGVAVEGLHGNNLRYYSTEFLPRERTNTNMRALVRAATDLLCIKEDLYDEEKTLGSIRLKPSLARLFRKGNQQMLVIYREEVILRIVEELEKLNFKEKLKVYLFAPGRYAFDDDFITVQDKVSLCALPAAIYDAYQKVLPKRKVKLLPEYEPQQNDELNFEEGREEQ